MPQKSEFKVVSGQPEKLDTLLAPFAAQNWRPILITSAAANAQQGVPVVVTIVLEHVRGA